MYFQLLFALDRVKALAPQHPEWKTTEPFASLLEGRRERRARGRRKGDAGDRHGDPRRHDDRRVRSDRQATGSPPPSIRRPSGPTPRWSTSRWSSCSPTSAPTASRPSSSPAAASSSCGRGRRKSTAFRPSRSSAPASRRAFELQDGKPVLMRLPELNFIDDKTGKPVGINQHIGRATDRCVRQLGRRPADARVHEGRQRLAARHARAARRCGARDCLRSGQRSAERPHRHVQLSRSTMKPRKAAGSSSA